MPSLPPLSTYLILQMHLYGLLATLIAWTSLWILVGYLIAYRRPKYIVVRESVRKRGFADPVCTENAQSEAETQ